MRRPRSSSPLAACATAASLFGAPCLAEPPDLDTGDFERGEVEFETNAWLRRGQSTVRPELELGLDQAVGLEIQLNLERGRAGDWAVDSVSAQVSRDLIRGGALGAAVELGVQPSTGDLKAEAFAYATRSVGRWRVDLNAGIEREDRASAAAYAWRLRRPLDARWSLGLEGGGSIGLGSGHGHHFVGPFARWRPDQDGPDIAVGVSREDGGHYALRLGFERSF